MAGYDRNKDVFEKIDGVNVKKKRERFLNIEVYSYDGGEKQIRIKPVNKNSNPNAEEKKTWIPQTGLSQITKEEAQGLIKALEKAIVKL